MKILLNNFDGYENETETYAKYRRWIQGDWSPPLPSPLPSLHFITGFSAHVSYAFELTEFSYHSGLGLILLGWSLQHLKGARSPLLLLSIWLCAELKHASFRSSLHESFCSSIPKHFLFQILFLLLAGWTKKELWKSTSVDRRWSVGRWYFDSVEPSWRWHGCFGLSMAGEVRFCTLSVSLSPWPS